MDRYSVMGNPVHHSKSPFIHAHFSKQTDQSILYDTTLVELDGLPAALDLFQSMGGKGVNITLPFKHRAFQLVDQHSERALEAGAVNTIRFNPDGSRFGDNTDGIGLVKDVTSNHNFSVEGKRVLVVGAGGAVSGVIGALLKESPSELVVANRTISKAVSLVDMFSSNVPMIGCGLLDLEGDAFDLVINGTSASLQDELLELPVSVLTDKTFCYDMVYGKGVTPFLSWVSKFGVGFSCDGIGMLVEQAAESFYLWRNVRPNTRDILSQLKSA